ncbi:MAG: hypothetical protein ACT4PU_10800 [Planctomycetota bacterium]
MSEGLVDRVLAALAMLAAIPPLLSGTLGRRSHVSWKRLATLLTGGAAALVASVGLLLLKAWVFGGPIFLPTWFGGTLGFLGGALGVATLMASRPPDGLSEQTALRAAVMALAMTLYVAAPRPALLLFGGTTLVRGLMTLSPGGRRWGWVLEGSLWILCSFVPREETLGGLRFAAANLGVL